MEVVLMHLQRDKKSGFLSYRRRFPTELVSLIPGKTATGLGRKELKVSLKARDINQPGARARYAEAEAEYEAIVARAQRLASRSYDRLDSTLISELAGRYLHDQLKTDETMRWGRPHASPLYVTRGDPEEIYEDCRELLEDYDSQGLVDYWKDWVGQFADGLGYLLDPRDPELPQLCRELGEAACKVWLAVDRRIDGESVRTPKAPQKLLHAKQALRSAEYVSILELYERWAAVPGRHPKTVADWRRRIEHLVQFLKTDDVRAITHDDLVRWRNYLRDEYTHRGKRLSGKTINGSFLGAVSALLAWAKGDGIISVNPMAEVSKVKLPRAARNRSPGFTIEEARRILSATLLPSTSREKEDLRNAKRWCPWLMAYSGARVNEITQLRKEDVFEQEGVWVMRITPEAGTVKSKSPRLVPLHSHLKEQGFIDFVGGRERGPLIYDPSKRRSDHAINRQANRLGSKLATWVRTLGIEGVMPNHAWRHHFSTAAVRYGLDPRVTKAITGHSSSDVHDKVYLEGLPEFVDVLSRELEKIPRFPIEAPVTQDMVPLT